MTATSWLRDGYKEIFDEISKLNQLEEGGKQFYLIENSRLIDMRIKLIIFKIEWRKKN